MLKQLEKQYSGDHVHTTLKGAGVVRHNGSIMKVSAFCGGYTENFAKALLKGVVKDLTAKWILVGDHDEQRPSQDLPQEKRRKLDDRAAALVATILNKEKSISA